MAADRNDPEIRAFVAASRAETYSDLAAAVAARFGPERAWPAEMVAQVRRELVPPIRSRSQYEADAEVMSFIADRADLVSIDRLGAAGVAAFGRDRFPRRSQLWRLVRKLRNNAP